MLDDRCVTFGRASAAWQETRSHITGLHWGMMLPLAQTDLTNMSMQTKKPMQPVKTPLELSVCKVALRSVLSSTPREMWGMGHCSAVLVSLSESFQTWAEPLQKSQNLLITQAFLLKENLSSANKGWAAQLQNHQNVFQSLGIYSQLGEHVLLSSEGSRSIIASSYCSMWRIC